VVFKGEGRENRIYIAIAILIIVVIVFAIFFSSGPLTKAYLTDHILVDSWSEDIAERDGGSQSFGLEKWSIYTYKNNDESFPAYVTVTSLKTLFMLSEDELLEKTIDTINEASEEGIVVDQNSKTTGVRAHKDGHKTLYILYDGNDTSKSPVEKIKIIGETWNCGVSGTSIICIGVSQISDYSNSQTELNMAYWAKIIKDEEGTFGIGEYMGDDGLLFNVKCH
jgi:hypothetical protein